MGEIELGDRVIDKINGFVGIATEVTHFLSGRPSQWRVDGETVTDRGPLSEWIDESRLEIVTKGIGKR